MIYKTTVIGVTEKLNIALTLINKKTPIEVIQIYWKRISNCTPLPGSKVIL